MVSNLVMFHSFLVNKIAGLGSEQSQLTALNNLSYFAEHAQQQLTRNNKKVEWDAHQWLQLEPRPLPFLRCEHFRIVRSRQVWWGRKPLHDFRKMLLKLLHWATTLIFGRIHDRWPCRLCSSSWSCSNKCSCNLFGCLNQVRRIEFKTVWPIILIHHPKCLLIMQEWRLPVQ